MKMIYMKMRERNRERERDGERGREIARERNIDIKNLRRMPDTATIDQEIISCDLKLNV